VRYTVNHLLGDLSFRCLGVFCHLSSRFNIDATNSDVAPPKSSPIELPGRLPIYLRMGFLGPFLVLAFVLVR
jgi:hypothetical protein